VCLVAAWAFTAWWQAHKPLPEGVHLSSAVCAVADDQVSFIADITAADAFGHALTSQGIFDAVLATVRGARRFIVLDYRAFGNTPDPGALPQRRIGEELTGELLARRSAQPELRILFITDPAIERPGSQAAPQLARLRAGGVSVVATDLDRLRDSNTAYSSLWRLAVRWWDTPAGAFGFESRRLNFKANERQLIIADDGRGGLVAVLGSANPSDHESAWSNLALRIEGGALSALLSTELAVAHFSGWDGRNDAFGVGSGALPAGGSACASPGAARVGSSRVQLLTEGAIQSALITRVDATASTDAIEVAMYRLADRGVIEALLAAARRGVAVRLILDPNEGASSGGAAGIPNQVAASELVSRSGGAIHVRWYRTHGERFHSALVMIYGPTRVWLLAGSATLTSRSLADFNLVADAAVDTEYTADFAAFADPSQADYWLYRLMEASGASAF
jgi:phosphatidylserine/phosphatidylglycerophosphate/cardiolipin synthase-like enzyme